MRPSPALAPPSFALAPRVVPRLVALALAAGASTASAADVCSLLTRAEAGEVLGQAVEQVVPAAPQRDEDSGGQLAFCTYRTSKAAVVVSVVEFRSASEARQQLSQNLVQGRMDGDEAKVSEEPGLGERAFYGASAKGATFVFLQKNRVVGIGVGGPSGSGTAKETLRKAAAAIASRL